MSRYHVRYVLFKLAKNPHKILNQLRANISEEASGQVLTANEAQNNDAVFPKEVEEDEEEAPPPEFNPSINS